MALITAFAKQAWSSGTRQYEAAVPSGISSVRFTIDRSSLTGTPSAGASIKFDLWLSQDSGTTWSYMGGGGYSDGVISAPNGCGAMLVLPNPASTTRRVRLELTLTKALNLAVTAETA